MSSEVLSVGVFLIQVGFIISASLAIVHVVKRFNIPAVLGLILGGLALGIIFGGALSEGLGSIKVFILELALAWIGFDIGNDIDLKLLRQKGKDYLIVLFGEAFGAFFIVTLVLFVLLQDLMIALILGSIAMATDPATTSQVLGEHEAKGDLSQALLFILAFDDILAILFVNVVLSILVSTAGGAAVGLLDIIQVIVFELAISVIVGIAAAILLVVTVKTFDLEDRNITEWILGMALLVAGITLFFEGSVILTMFVFGIAVKTLEFTQEEGFHEHVEDSETLFIPVVLLFFILIGLDMNLELIFGSVIIIFASILYFIARVTGKGAGSYISGSIAKMERKICVNLPMCLIAQAGVVIGLADLAFHQLTELGRIDDANLILNVVGVSVIFAQLIGPLLVHKALIKCGESGLYGNEEAACAD